MARTGSLASLASTLTGRLVLALAGIQVVVLPLVFLGFGRSVRADYESRFVDGARGDAYQLASIVAAQADEERLPEMLDDLLLDARIVYADARIGDRVLKPTIELVPGSSQFTEDFRFGEHGDGTYFIATGAPRSGDGEPLELRLGLDEGPTREQVGAAYARFAEIVAAYIGVSLLAALLIVPRLTRSLRKLGAAARRVASGDLSADLAIQTSVNDVAALAGDLEWMRTEIVSTTREIAARELETRAIVENAADGIITIDVNGEIETANRSIEDILGYDHGELRGRRITDIIPPGLREDHSRGVERYLRSGETKMLNNSVEVEGLGRDGKTVPLRLAVSEVQVARKRSFTAIIQDITKQRELEEMKAHFLSAVSHEIRTPLNAIVSAATILKKYGKKKPDSVERFAGVISEEGARLTRLINNMLDLAKMEAGETDWEMGEVHADALIDRIGFLAAAAAGEKGVRLTTKVDADLPAVYADFDKIVQVLTNLTNNAVKFTESGGAIEVRAVRHNDRNVRFFVRDSGKGIAEPDQPRVFEKFKQVGGKDPEAAKGTGLGLHICKEIIDVHGGKIWVESKLGEGSTFAFTLVVAGAARSASTVEVV